MIATAPFTASTDRFVSAVPDISAPSHITHISHSSPFLSFIASPDVRDDRTSDTEEILTNDEVTNEEGTPSSSVVESQVTSLFHLQVFPSTSRKDSIFKTLLFCTISVN